MATEDLHWKRDPETGVERMPDTVSEFLDWLLSDPRVPSTQGEWAKAHGLHADTPRRWKNDPRFKREWERRAADLNMGIERTQLVVEALFANAISGDTKAQLAYLEYVGRHTPKQIIVTEESDTREKSDEELAAELDGLVPQLRSA